jgi:hypothetical protein
MKMNYYQYTLSGEHSAAEAQSALGKVASQGLIVRIDTVEGQTHVYVASPTAITAKAAAGMKSKKVSESEIIKMR